MNHRDQDARTAPMDLGDCPHHAIGAAALNGQVAHLRVEQAALLPSSSRPRGPLRSRSWRSRLHFSACSHIHRRRPEYLAKNRVRMTAASSTVIATPYLFQAEAAQAGGPRPVDQAEVRRLGRGPLFLRHLRGLDAVDRGGGEHMQVIAVLESAASCRRRPRTKQPHAAPSASSRRRSGRCQSAATMMLRDRVVMRELLDVRIARGPAAGLGAGDVVVRVQSAGFGVDQLPQLRAEVR